MRDGEIDLRDVFVFENLGVSPEGVVTGRFQPAGGKPLVWERLQRSQAALSESIFQPEEDS